MPLKMPQTMATVALHDQTRYNVVRLLVVGLLFHLVYIGSVFDCYFTSPVVHGMRSYGSEDAGSASAKRLVLIVGDGLRADLLFTPSAFQDILGSDSPDVVAPYLRSVVETRGAFGISHTRVPTESRPGHVAIIGGMYEDVSAVTKGWKTNPVDFDSVFNQSSTTFSFGSPDIIPMFARGATPPEKVKTWCYDEDEEDFTKDATALDVWVLDHLKALLKNATTDLVLDSQLRSEKVIFFLHLLGLDTTGHSYRPHSKEYMENIRVVDNIVRETERLISEFYKDEDTSFVFTADHGMSTIGNHGDGHPDNTQTPLIVWGSGVRGPLPDIQPSSHDTYSEPWKLGHLFRRDVEQADITALMAALVGIDWPVNSVGVIPDVDPTRPGYLALKDGDKGKAKVGLINAKVVILEQYRIKDELKRKHALFYTPFPLLTSSTTHHRQESDTPFPQLTSIEKLISEEQWFAARQASSTLIQQTLQGLHYLQTYDRFLIRGIVSAAYMGWAAYAILHVVRPLDYRFIGDKPSSPSTSTTPIVTVASWMVLLAFWTLFALQHSPWSFYVYIAFPCYFWWRVLVEACIVVSDWNNRRTTSSMVGRNYTKSYFGIAIKLVMVISALQGMVAGYTYRSIWSIGFVLIGVIWPFFWNEKVRSTSSWAIYRGWSVSCLVTAVFPLLSIDKKESLLTIIAGGLAVLSTGLFGAYYVAGQTDGKHSRRYFLILTMIQATFITIAMAITGSSVSKLQAKAGLPFANQVAGWVVLVASSLIPFLYPSGIHTVQSKLVMYFLGFGPCFVILSISEEGLFYVAYSITLVFWIQVEQIVRLGNRREPRDKNTVNRNAVEQAGEYLLQWDDIRTALFFLFFVQVGFFGTGNVASISSFYLAPVYRLIPIFNPFYMATLLIFKIVAPYIMLAVIFAVLNDTLNLPPFSLLSVALTITDGMTLTFFFKVQDTGSWLEIGQSISFFCITSMLLLWSAGICAAGEYLMKDVLLRGASDVQVSIDRKKS